MSNTKRAVLPAELVGRATLLGRRAKKVRNQSTGRVLPCCWADCDRDGDANIDIKIDHEKPRWPGEKLVYVFCSEAHRDMYAANRRNR